MSNFVNLLDIIYPVGSIYQSMSATSPVDFIGGTWTKIKTFLYGADTAKETGGEATHTLTIDEMPSHEHGIVVAVVNGGDAAYHRILFATNSPAWNNGKPDWNNAAKSAGGGKHTTTCRHTQPVSSGIAQHSFTERGQLKSKRGGVCLTTLISWILSTQLGQYLFQIIQSRQQTSSVERGRNSMMTRLSAAEHQIQLAVQTLLRLQLTKCRHMAILFGGVLLKKMELFKTFTGMVKGWQKRLIQLGVEKSTPEIQTILYIKTVGINRLITAQNTGPLTSISAQPSYTLGGVA